ncbi:MAG: hypothetical protein ACYC1I_11565 [Acidimicrobiales bacterium]
MDTDTLLVELVEALDQDLELLAVLRYRMVVLGALAGADQSSSLPLAVREIELAYESLRLAEIVRATVTEKVADEFDIHPMPRIDEIATYVSAGWSNLLLERRQNLIESVSEIQGLSRTIVVAMGRRVALAEEAFAFLHTDTTATYGRPSSRGGVLVEGAI